MPSVTIAINRVEGPNEYGWFNVYDQSGKQWDTNDPELASYAESLVGQTVEIEGDTKEKSYTAKDGSPRKFTNHYLRGLTPSQSAIPVPEAVRGAPPTSQGYPVGPQELRAKMVELGLKSLTPEEWATDEVSIHAIRYARTYMHFVETGE